VEARNREMKTLSDFLARDGYVQLVLTRTAVGHFHTKGTLNGRPVEVLVDSGASVTVIAIDVVRALGLVAERFSQDAGGAGGAIEQFVVKGVQLRLGQFTPRLGDVAGLEFEHVNAPLRANGVPEVDVILGADVFDAHAAVIDYATRSLFLRA
jgi:predicted aspartyl protease